MTKSKPTKHHRFDLPTESTMNVSAKSNTRIPWRRIIPVALALIVIGYSYSRPTLEKWFNVSLPALTDQNQRRDSSNNSPSPSSTSNEGSYKVTLPTDANSSGKFAIKEVGRDRYETPAGLLYTMGPRGEHRIEHVMRHAKDQPSRPAHGVFLGDGDQDAVLQIIDDAYSLVKKKSPRAKYESSDGKDKYDVDMQRKVGFDGGQKGQRNSHRALNKVRMILDGNRVITAFPVK